MKTELNVAFGKRVAELRKQAGYSQEQFAFKCEVDRTYIGTIERGEKSPTLNTIEKIANALGISKSELFNYWHINYKDKTLFSKEVHAFNHLKEESLKVYKILT